jgi:SAM-dependent methyltransferase
LGDFDGSWFTGEVRGRDWDFIVLDRFRTPGKEFALWAALGPVIGIDEGGRFRDKFDFLIDVLPGLPGRSPPNIASPALLPLGKTRRLSGSPERSGNRPLRILVSFGLEDSAGLTIPLARAAVSPETEVTAVFGLPPPLLRDKKKRSAAALESMGVGVERGTPELRERLAGYDLVITHFGVTAFECLHAGAPVLLASPTGYHEKLALGAGFVSLGRGKKTGKNLRRYLFKNGRIDYSRLKSLEDRRGELADRYGLCRNPPETLGSLLDRVTPLFPQACPACGGRRARTLARFKDRTYLRCSGCGLAYMLRIAPPPVSYGGEYFFREYKAQYGKTYLEDFPGLVKTGKTRLERIAPLLPPSGGERRLLDIGCAYGPFLAAAREGGFSPLGLDPAEDAVRYVQDHLAIPALRGFFPAAAKTMEGGSFDVVSLWYVLEHFPSPGEVLREINRLLKPGGVLAFSTPSLSGITGRFSSNRFLEKSPPDHWTIWTPGCCGKITAQFGFDLTKVVVTGHHPERFPLPPGRGELAYPLLYTISRAFGLGDTFEAYAVKRRDYQVKGADNG